MEEERTNTTQVSAIVFLALTIVAGSVIPAALISATIVPASGANQTGNIKAVNFQVYWDRSCTNVTNTLSWGIMEPDATRNITVYIKNTGAIPERLSMRASNWKPTTAQKYIQLTWDYENTILNPASNITATFTLRISPNVANVTDYSFDIKITGAQYWK